MILFNTDMKYAEFLLLNQGDRLEFIYGMRFLKDVDILLPANNYVSDKPIEELSFGTVKQLMECFESGEDCLMFLCGHPETCDDYSLEKMLRLPAWKVLRTAEFLNDTVESFIQAESEMLSSIFPNKYKAQTEQIGFDMFSAHFIQRDSLAGGDVLKYDEVDKLPYSMCLAKLTLDQKRSNLQDLVMQTSK